MALEYQGSEGGDLQGKHVHGGRQEGKYVDSKTYLKNTHGCMRMDDNDIKRLRQAVTRLETADPNEHAGTLTLKDDLSQPVYYKEKNSPYKAHIVDAGGDGYTNMRPEPGSGDPTRVDAGVEVEVLEKGDKYSKIKYSGKTGYVPNTYVQDATTEKQERHRSIIIFYFGSFLFKQKE